MSNEYPWINENGIDYVEVNNLVNPPNPANAGMVVGVGEDGKAALVEGGSGGGLVYCNLHFKNSGGGGYSVTSCDMTYDEIKSNYDIGVRVYVVCIFDNGQNFFEMIIAPALYENYYDNIRVSGMSPNFECYALTLTPNNSWSFVKRTVPSA